MTSKMQRVHILDGIGSFGNHEVPRIVEKAVKLGVEETIALAALSDKNRATAVHARKLPLPDDCQLIINPEEIKDAFGYMADQLRAEARAGRASSINEMFHNAHVGKATSLNLETPFALFPYSISAGHKYESKSRLQKLKIRLPDEIGIGDLVYPDEQYLRDNVHLDPHYPIELVDSHLLHTSVATDNLGPIAKVYGKYYQDDLRALGIAGLMAAPYMFSNQKTAADSFMAMSRYGALIGVSVGIRSILPKDTIWWYDPIAKTFGFPRKGRPSISDTITQLIEASKDAIHKPEWRMLDEPPSERKQAFLCFIVPFELGDRKGWRTFVPEVELFITNHYPWITPLWVSGYGIAAKGLENTAPYWLNSILFYPLPDTHKVIREIIATEPMIRRASMPTTQVMVEADNGQTDKDQVIKSTPLASS